MLRNCLYTVSLIAMGCVASAAHAAEASRNNYNLFFKPYVGADYQYTSVDYQDDPTIGITGDSIADDTLHGVNMHVGARVHRYLGFEAGYLLTDNGTKKNVLGTGINTKTRLYGYNIDAMGYFPLSGWFELIGTVGISRLTQKFGATGFRAEKDTETKGRIGAGMQYWLTNNASIRAIVRYQGMNFDNSADGAVIADLGFNYMF